VSGFFNSLFSANSTATPGVAHNGPPPAPVPSSQAAPVAAPPTQEAPAPVTPVSQLDQFAALWQNPTSADGKPQPIPADPLTQPIYSLDPAKIQESVGKIDFTAGIPPETLGKIAAGGQEAVSAFAEALNIGLRQAVAGLAVQQGTVLNQAMLANNQRLVSTLPSHINKTQLLNEGSDDPVMAHPAVQPLVNSLKQMAFAKNPSANPAEINKQVTDYLKGLSAAITETSPTAVAARTAAAAKEQDWSLFLDGK
jgi:hypothetical protein